MRRQHLTSVALAAVLVACSDDAMTRLSSAEAGHGPSGPDDIGGQGGGGGASAPETLGELDIVDIADSDCATPEGDAADLFEGQPYPLIAQRIARIEDHYVAYGADVEGLMWFDDAGVAFSEQAGTVVAAAVGGNRLWAAMADGALLLQRFKPSGALAGAARVIADEAPAAVAIAVNDDAVTLAWAESGRILARTLMDGQLREPVVVADEAWTSFARIGIAAAAEGNMAIAWTGDVTPGSMRTSFALVGPQAMTQAPLELFTTSGHHELVELEPTSTGFAMLLTGGLPELHPYLLMLDAAGNPAGPAGRLLGAHFGWDLASRAHEVGVVSSRHSGEPELRLFDTAATPLGAWICLATRGDIDLPVALAAEPEGFATLYFEPENPPDGRELFRRIALEDQP